MQRALAASLVVIAIGCGAATPHGEHRVGATITLRETGWDGATRARVERAISEIAARSGRRVATFDWDNTMMRGDIGDLVLAHALEHDLLIAPDWERLAVLTAEARAELASSCGVAAGSPLPTGGGASACARAIAHVAWHGTTTSGAPAFTTPVAPTYRATYGFMVEVLAGHTDDALRAIARDAFAAAEAAPIGARAEIGGVEVERFARLHAPMIEIARALAGAGVETWIVSASMQPIVEVLAERAGIPAERVIGVRTTRDAAGRATSDFEWIEDGVPVITWHEGKRRWIERVIGARPAFAAGDSDGDVAMLSDAEHRLVLDRHGVRLMCLALSGGWIVHPQFVDPPPPRTEPYPCSTYRDPLGAITDLEGRPIDDQRVPRVDDRGGS